MTIPSDAEFAPSKAEYDIDPIPVRVVEVYDPHQSEAADFGSLTSVTVTNTQAIQILNRRPTRKQAVIANTQVASPFPVILSHRLEPLQLATPQGYTLNPGLNLTIESQQPVYAIAVGGACLISLLDEAYDAVMSNEKP